MNFDERGSGSGREPLDLVEARCFPHPDKVERTGVKGCVAPRVGDAVKGLKVPCFLPLTFFFKKTSLRCAGARAVWQVPAARRRA